MVQFFIEDIKEMTKIIWHWKLLTIIWFLSIHSFIYLSIHYLFITYLFYLFIISFIHLLVISLWIDSWVDVMNNILIINADF